MFQHFSIGFWNCCDTCRIIYIVLYCFGVVILSQYSSEHGVSLVLYFMCPFVYCCIHNFHVKRCSCWRSKWPPWRMRSLPSLTCIRVFMVWVFFFVLAKGHVSFSHHLSYVVNLSHLNLWNHYTKLCQYWLRCTLIGPLLK